MWSTESTSAGKLSRRAVTQLAQCSSGLDDATLKEISLPGTCEKGWYSPMKTQKRCSLETSQTSSTNRSWEQPDTRLADFGLLVLPKFKGNTPRKRNWSEAPGKGKLEELLGKRLKFSYSTFFCPVFPVLEGLGTRCSEAGVIKKKSVAFLDNIIKT